MEKEEIKSILLEQKEEIKRIFSEKLIDRDVGKKLKKSIDDPLIKVITGVRRSGKSVLSHQILSGRDYGYVNFDDERLLGIKANALNDFLEVSKEIEPNLNCLLFDEIQNVRGWELFVNRLKRLGYNTTITGSNSELLSKELATHLTGRHIEITVFPFSFKEFLLYCGKDYKENDFYIAEKRAELKNLFADYLRFGGFPELFKVTNKDQYIIDLYDKIVSRDVIMRHNIKYVKELREAALYLLSNFSLRISYNKIKNVIGIKSVHTIKNYINCLEEAYLIFQLYPFSYKIKHQLMQPKKVYIVDHGFVNALLSKSSPDYGRVYENIVFMHLLRTGKRVGKELYFYYGESYEVDFVIRSGLNIVQLIQVCYDVRKEETKKRELKALAKAMQNFKLKEATIITSDYESEEKTEHGKIKFVPLWKWLLVYSGTR